MNKKIVRLKPKGRRFLRKFDVVVCYKQKRAKGDYLEKIGFLNLSGVRELSINLQR
jgi:ribosomal protein S16